MTLRKMMIWFYEQYLKMDDFNKTSNIYPNLAANIPNQQQFRLNKINEMRLEKKS